MAEAMSTGSGKTHRLEKNFAVRQISPPGSNVLEYQGLQTLAKPTKMSRGVYGGNLCAQTLVVAMESVPANEGFVPHSLHSYFVKAGDDTIPCNYQVEKLNDGKNFANRLIRVVQNGELKYIVMVSLTKKNSLEKAKKEYNNNEKNPYPFEFQSAVPSTFYKYPQKDLELNTNFDHSGMLQHKFPPNFVDHELENDEHLKAAGDRELSFYIRLKEEEQLQSKYRYAGFAMVSDSIYLSSLSRILHLPKLSSGLPISVFGEKAPYFFSVSLDHSIYFHDDDFDPKEWAFVNFKAPRFSNNRVLLQAGYYDKNGKLFATIVQEGLVFFKNGTEHKAKL
ncbi:thioesterase-like superfamily-domain-containing protein [Scheffersomyces xylosifermentans]|uniref:thioesterase-like superfamily-domain-containing protein n=1 Tax=Scheffersomyces xylosifermentans TaxID=1304137 RepID=UPI00315D6312